MMIKLIGLVLIVVGAGLGYWGYELGQGLGSQLASSITGAPPDAVMIRYITGAAALVAGLFLTLKA